MPRASLVLLLLALTVPLARADEGPSGTLEVEMQVATRSFPERQERLFLLCRPRLTATGACLLKLYVEAQGEPGEGAPGPMGYFEAEVDVPRATAWGERMNRLNAEGKAPPRQLDVYNTPGQLVRYARVSGGTLTRPFEGYWFDGDAKYQPWVLLWNELREAASKSPRFAAELGCKRAGKSTAKEISVACELKNVGKATFNLPAVAREQARLFSLKSFQSIATQRVEFIGKPLGARAIEPRKSAPFSLRFVTLVPVGAKEPLRVALDIRKDPGQPELAETGTMLRVLLYSSRIP